MSAPSPYHLPRETELQVRLDEAEQVVRARDDFIAIASHELRSPMTALALRLHAIEAMAQQRGDPQLTAEIRRARRSVDRHVRRAVVLLDVSRLNTGNVLLQRAAVNIRELLRTIVEVHTDEAAFHGTKLTAVVEHDATGWWDPHMVEQILSNLVNNAVKYGGATPVRLHAGASGGFARFCVSDGGPGIDAAQRARILPEVRARGAHGHAPQRLRTRAVDRRPHGRRPRRHDRRGDGARPRHDVRRDAAPAAAGRHGRTVK